MSSSLVMSATPRFSVLVASSLDFVGIFDDLEAVIRFRFNYDIRLAPDAVTVPLQEYLPSLVHLLRQMFSIRDLEFARV